MGLYRRGHVWWMSFTVGGKPHCETTGTTNKRLAKKIWDRRYVEIIEGRYRLPNANTPRLESFAQQFLASVVHPNTKKRYTSSVGNLLEYFGDPPLAQITSEGIDEFKMARLGSEVRSATVNRDLAVLRRMLKIAERRRLITASVFREVEMLEERKQRRQPHILTFEEEKQLLASAPAHIRALVVLIVETGLRSGREALALKWKDVDFVNKEIQILQSKSVAGIRNVPMSKPCKTELLTWRELRGPAFSEYVFPNPQRPETHLVDVRVAWTKAVQDAGIERFWIYDLRHTFASRITAAGVSHIFAAQLMGHSSPNILHTYAKAISDFRRSAITKLENFREMKAEKLP
jgi:integrase